MSDTNFDDVGFFHHRFGLDNVEDNGVGPRDLTQMAEIIKFRSDFLAEEKNEFDDAWAANDVFGMADALIDLVYIAMGTAHLLGLPWQELWDDVQRANMAKKRAARDGSDSRRNSQFDVIKPVGWVPPKTREIMESHGW